MKTINTLRFGLSKAKAYWMLAIIGIISCGFACEEDLPDVGEFEDTTPPVASFEYATDEENYFMTRFTNLSISATSYAWSFGDGGVSDQEHPEYVYSEVGTYDVKLIAYDGNAVLNDTTITLIVAIPPLASFTFERDIDSEVDNTYNFTNLSEDAISYEWNFGNGVKSSEFEPTISYASNGIFNVTLTVVNEAGTSNMTSQEIVVGAAKPELVNPDFETLDFPTSTSGSTCYCFGWVDTGVGRQPQTTSDTYEGSGAIKMPLDGSRVGYQEFAIDPGYNYNLRFFYSGNEGGDGLTVRVISAPISTLEEADALTVAEIVLTGTGGTKTWAAADFDFSSGASSTMAIVITGSGVDYRLDNFDITVVYD